MKNLKETIATATIITADFDMVKKYNDLVKKGESIEDALKVVNGMVKTMAVNSVKNGNHVDEQKIVDLVQYQQIDVNGEFYFKEVKAGDVFIKQENKKSNKVKVAQSRYCTLNAYGVNMSDAKLSDLADGVLGALKVYTQYLPDIDCFTCDTRTSNNMLEKQLQVFADEILGENSVKITKHYSNHLKEEYVKATKKGYKIGDEIALLQLIYEHIRTCKNGIRYAVTSKLNAHKAPKETKKA